MSVDGRGPGEGRGHGDGRGPMQERFHNRSGRTSGGATPRSGYCTPTDLANRINPALLRYENN